MSARTAATDDPVSDSSSGRLCVNAGATASYARAQTSTVKHSHVWYWSLP